MRPRNGGSTCRRRRVWSLNVWRRHGERAPHKPLLVLYALGKCYRGESRLIPYHEVGERVRELLIEFGPIRRSYHPELPFWHLQTDGVWEISRGETTPSGADLPGPKRRAFLEGGYWGGFPQDLYGHLAADKPLLQRIARSILFAHFPPSIHEDIAAAVGLDLEPPAVSTAPSTAVSGAASAASPAASAIGRNPLFREEVMRAYEYRCAVCAFQGRLGDALVGLDAAHIKWHQAGGPDETVNGLALCVLHHKLFDRGVFTLTGSLRIQVSERANGGGIFDHLVLDFNGEAIRLPQRRSYYPYEEFVDWHAREVFQGPGRWMPGEEGNPAPGRP